MRQNSNSDVPQDCDLPGVMASISLRSAISRRSAMRAGAVVAVGGWLSGQGLLMAHGAQAAGDEVVAKLDEPADDFRVFGIGARIEVNGQVQTRDEKGGAQALPLKLTAGISFRERRLLGPGRDAEALRSLREYEQTTAEIVVGGEASRRQLADKLRLIVAQGRTEGIELYSLGGPMTTDEMELLQTPGDTLSLIALLPGREVKVGETWTPDYWVLPMFMAVEAVVDQKLTCTFVGLTGNLARISFTGELNGAIDGATTKVSVEGNLDFDIVTKSIAEVELAQVEKRSIGAVSPGLDITARLRLRRRPAQIPGRVGDQQFVDEATKLPTTQQMRVRFDAPWGLTILHGRAWQLYHETQQVAIFRKVKDGQFIAQCNISPLASAPAGSHLPEADFESDIRTALGDRLKTMPKKEVIPAANGRFVYRVVAQGLQKEQAITWIYFLVAERTGRQTSLLFSLDSALLEKFGKDDLEFVEGLSFGMPSGNLGVPTLATP
ncbi:MAG: hypothetical protein C0478_04035 [Planctomyces sp.]|nr:hypothetical protein [Planctomyces sp.]